MNEGIPIATEPTIPAMPSPEAVPPNTPTEPEPTIPDRTNVSSDNSRAESRENDARRISELRDQLGIYGDKKLEIVEPKIVRSAEELKEMDFYERLNLSPDATEADIKAARKIMFDYHPDHGGDDEAMKEVNEAYSTLNDPELRKKYDAGLESSTEAGFQGTRDVAAYSYPNPENMSREFWEGINGVSSEKSQENFASLEQIDSVKNMINEKIQQLEGRDSGEFITRERTLYHSSRIETTVADYLALLKESLQSLESNDRISREDLSAITIQSNGEIKFLGKSKFGKWWRKNMSI